MHGRKLFEGASVFAAAMLVGVILSALPAAASSEEVIYSFSPNGGGVNPTQDLIADAAGNLYGTTVDGGDQSMGVVFELSPKNGGWQQQVLYSFQSDDGVPTSGLAWDAAGNLYGETGGGANDAGMVYELSLSGGTWVRTVLYSFVDQSTGSFPLGGVVLDAKGNIYGTTQAGGDPFGLGTVFELSPDGKGNWTEQVIHAFGRAKDGGLPQAGVVFDSHGNLFGTTLAGYSGGTIFELTPQAKGKWKRVVLHRFTGGKDGEFPSGKLIFDAAGNLYGTAESGGAAKNQNGCDFGCGTVYRLSPKTGASGFTFSVLYSFAGGKDGRSPDGTLAFDGSGNLYGTTETGGGNGCEFGYGCGTAFQLSPSAKGPWAETVLHRFAGSDDGLNPQGSLLPDKQGNWYGTTSGGGDAQSGTVFEITP